MTPCEACGEAPAASRDVREAGGVVDISAVSPRGGSPLRMVLPSWGEMEAAASLSSDVPSSDQDSARPRVLGSGPAELQRYCDDLCFEHPSLIINALVFRASLGEQQGLSVEVQYEEEPSSADEVRLAGDLARNLEMIHGVYPDIEFAVEASDPEEEGVAIWVFLPEGRQNDYKAICDEVCLKFGMAVLENQAARDQMNCRLDI
jgi:hypothetical protein